MRWGVIAFAVVVAAGAVLLVAPRFVAAEVPAIGVGASGVGAGTAGAAGGSAVAPGAGAGAASAPTPLAPEPVDFCYVEKMVSHHEQALTMSGYLLEKEGVWPRASALAEFIVYDQSREIDAMRGWQDAWSAEIAKNAGSAAPATRPHSAHAGATPVPSAQEPTVAAGVLVDCGTHASHDGTADGEDAAGAASVSPAMPGMLSDAELAALRDAPTAQAQTMFLEMMIRHHEGAVQMARELIATGSNAFAVGSAKHVVDEQQREVDAMRTMIAELG
ncbi:uncharacterized protein (DUF305 family) [Compostimonas suwonensis]|uniref:Uncharacterized protein (DUF305 family) n=2 Tax=Compostimonas suwonensis TaxID=1048394 RepID=A0A2M9BC53_9MICO|nr:uncharacterized protein (DUF305 family) [Compostimonas suwonensis]